MRGPSPATPAYPKSCAARNSSGSARASASAHPECLPWHELSDASAVAPHDLLNDFLLLFESHYLGQIRRYRHGHSPENLTQLSFLSDDPNPAEDPDAPSF